MHWDTVSPIEAVGSQLQVPYLKQSSNITSPPKDLGHINSLALCEVQAALKDMEITNKVCFYQTLHILCKAHIRGFHKCQIPHISVFNFRLKPEGLSAVHLVQALFSLPTLTLALVTLWQPAAW